MQEEVNRVLTDRISNLLFCPTDIAVNNLKEEGYNYFNNRKVKNVGDIMFEGAIHYSRNAKKPSLSHNLNLNNFVLATIHRSETIGNIENLKSVIKALNVINQSSKVVMPVHPRTFSIISNHGINVDFEFIRPVGYLEMIWLIQNCSLVITDSGGLQKEAYFFKKCCLTTRTETEWKELVDSGNNILVNQDVNRIISEFNKSPKFKPFGNIYGDGNTSELIINAIIESS